MTGPGEKPTFAASCFQGSRGRESCPSPGPRPAGDGLEERENAAQGSQPRQPRISRSRSLSCAPPPDPQRSLFSAQRRGEGPPRRWLQVKGEGGWGRRETGTEGETETERERHTQRGTQGHRAHLMPRGHRCRAGPPLPSRHPFLRRLCAPPPPSTQASLPAPFSVVVLVPWGVSTLSP